MGMADYNLKQTVGWIVELEPNVWLVTANHDPARTTKIENATRYHSEKSAKRAVGLTRRLSGRVFKNIKVSFIGSYE